jgi:hypothetical protein
MTDPQLPNDINDAISYHRQLASTSNDLANQLATIHDFALQMANHMSNEWWIHAIKLIDAFGKSLPNLALLPLDNN